MTPALACRLCGGAAVRLFQRTVLARLEVGYHQCPGCGLTQTDEPTWLDQAYAEPISPTDTGVLLRNAKLRDLAGVFLHLMGVREQTCLDYAGGYGVFTRLMRDDGFDFRWLDAHAPNLFARGFEWDPGRGRPLAVTAFEVLEHFVRPLEEFRRIASLEPDWVITSTELHPGPRPAPDWHYLSAESGQHVAFYRRDTLARLGRECGYPFVLAGPYYQVFARRRFPAWRWRLAERAAPLLAPFVRRRRRSLTLADCLDLRRRPPRP